MGFLLFPLYYKSAFANIVVLQAEVPSKRCHLTEGARRGHSCFMDTVLVVYCNIRFHFMAPVETNRQMDVSHINSQLSIMLSKMEN